MTAEAPPEWDEPNDPTAWKRSWSDDEDNAGENPTWPKDGRDTHHPATEAALPTDTVGALREAHRRVRAGDPTLPADAAAYLAQRTPFGLDYYERFGEGIEIDRRGWPVASWVDDRLDDDSSWLTAAEWLELSDYLSRAENLVNAGLEISSTQGLFTASAVGPADIDADASFKRIIAANLDGDPRRRRIVSLLARMRQETIDAFTLDEPFEPIYVDDDDGQGDRAYAFAMGFFEGIALEEKSWERARRFEDVESALSVIYTLSMDGAGQTWPNTDLPASQLREALPNVLQGLHDFLLTRRRGAIVREEPKIGRNDPCTCGSGKKYKKCHGATARTSSHE